MVLSSRISVRLSHDACPGFSARFQSFKRICPRKFKQISQQSSNRFVCTSGGLKGDMLEDPLEKPSTTFEAIKQRHFNPNPRLRQKPGKLNSAQCVVCTVFFSLDRRRWDISYNLTSTITCNICLSQHLRSREK